MCNLWTIYQYELKKLVRKRLIWVTAFLCVVCLILNVFAGLFGTYYVDGEPVESNYESFRKDQAYQKALSGRAIDEALLKETVEGYSHVPTDTLRYSLTREYEAYARPYSEIFNLLRVWTGMELSAIQNWEADETAFYEARAQHLENNWQSIPLTETEKAFWRNQESQMVTPFPYSYHKGYENILDCFLSVGVLMLLFVAVCLSNLFSEEHIRRTDQLVLSSIAGKKSAYWAKILAGITVSVIASTGMSLLTIGLNLGYFGTEGFRMPLQICFLTYSYAITIGEACLIAYGVLVIASVLAAVFVMLVSELFRSGIAALALSAGLIMLGNVIMIPTQYRVISRIWDWSPTAYLSPWNVFDARTLTLFGHCFTSWQVVPVGYLLLSALLAALGSYIYRSYQVSGR